LPRIETPPSWRIDYFVARSIKVATRTITEQKAERAALITEVEGLLDAADSGDRAMTTDEQAKFDAATARIAEMNIDIDRRVKLEAVSAPAFASVIPAPLQAQPRSTPPTDEVQATVRQVESGPRIEIPRSYGRLVAFAKTPVGHMEAYRAGHWLRATLYGDVNSQDWCRRNGVGARAALAGGVNTSGGALVPDELERAIIDLREEYGLFRRVCRVAPMGSDTLNVPRRTGGLTAYFVGENTAGTESDAAWDNVALVAKKLMVLTRMSSEVSEDAVIDLADTLAQEIAYAFAVKEDTVGFTGTGISTDGGILGVFVKALLAGNTKAKVAAASGHDLMSEIDADDLLNLMAAVPQYAKAGAAWYCGPSAQELIFNAIKIAGGGNTRDLLAQSDTPRFLGYPIYVSPVLPDSPATNYNGAAILGFGNLRQAATMGDRRGIRVALSNEQYWEEDQIGVKGTERFDINVHDLGSTTVKSPFAVLVGTT
jgi:HK97 family phage major capsid protein